VFAIRQNILEWEDCEDFSDVVDEKAQSEISQFVLDADGQFKKSGNLEKEYKDVSLTQVSDFRNTRANCYHKSGPRAYHKTYFVSNSCGLE